MAENSLDLARQRFFDMLQDEQKTQDYATRQAGTAQQQYILQAMRNQAASGRADVLWGRQQEMEGIKQGNRIELEKFKGSNKAARSRFGAKDSGDITPVDTGAGGGGKGGGDVGEASAQAAYEYYTTQKNLPPVVAAGLAGNFDAESSWNSNIVGDAGASIGLGQWNGARRANLMRFATMRGHQFPTVQDQLDFPIFEAQSGSDPGAATAFKLAGKAQSAEESADIFRKFYERPKPGPTDQTERRRKVAANLYSGTGRRYAPDGTVTTAGGNEEVTEPSDNPEEESAEDDNNGMSEDELLSYLQDWEKADLQATHPNEMAVGHAAYTDAQFGLIPDTSRLYPLSKTNPSDLTEYLVLRDRPKPAVPQVTADGQPLAPAAPAVTQAPAVTVKTSGSNNRTRINKQTNKMEMMTDNGWVELPD